MFKVEYSKSGKAKCKKCNSFIENGVVRIAKMVQSPFHDGKMPVWHKDCFFQTSIRLTSVDEIEGFQLLRWEDQQAISQKVQSTFTSKGTSNSVVCVEYAKSDRSACRECVQKIEKGKIRMSFQVDNPARGPSIPAWFYPPCFFKDVSITDADLKKLKGFSDMKLEDANRLEEALREHRKRKLESGENPLRKLENLMILKPNRFDSKMKNCGKPETNWEVPCL